LYTKRKRISTFKLRFSPVCREPVILAAGNQPDAPLGDGLFDLRAGKCRGHALPIGGDRGLALMAQALLVSAKMVRIRADIISPVIDGRKEICRGR
jgi:hypothetical protein